MDWLPNWNDDVDQCKDSEKDSTIDLELKVSDPLKAELVEKGKLDSSNLTLWTIYILAFGSRHL